MILASFGQTALTATWPAPPKVGDMTINTTGKTLHTHVRTATSVYSVTVEPSGRIAGVLLQVTCPAGQRPNPTNDGTCVPVASGTIVTVAQYPAPDRRISKATFKANFPKAYEKWEYRAKWGFAPAGVVGGVSYPAVKVRTGVAPYAYESLQGGKADVHYYDEVTGMYRTKRERDWLYDTAAKITELAKDAFNFLTCTAAPVAKMSPDPRVVAAATVAETLCRKGATQPTPTASKYPPNTIATFDTSISAYRVAVPIGLSGMATHQEVEQVAQLAADPNVSIVDSSTYQAATGTAAWYKKWQTWAAVGGVAALGTIGVLAVRKFRRR
jgi:hypothetical protein